MTLSSKQEGHIIMFVVICIFATNIPANKYLYSSGLLNPVGMTVLRIVFATIVFWMVSLFVPKEKVERKDMLILFIGGVFGMIFNQGFFAYGLSRTSSIDASIISTSGPLYAMIIAAILLKEPITPKKIAGVTIGAAGAIFLVYMSRSQHLGQQGDMLGNIMVSCGSFSYAFYLVVTRPLSNKYSPITLMKWMFLYSMILTLPFLYKQIIEAPLFKQSDALPFILIFFTLFGATFLTYMMIPLAQRRIRATTISMYNNLQPLIASFIAIMMGMDRFTIDKLIAGIFIFAGVYLVTISKSRADIIKSEFD